MFGSFLVSPVPAGAMPLIEYVYAVPSVLGPAGGTVTVLAWQTSWGSATCRVRFDGTWLRGEPPPALVYSTAPRPCQYTVVARVTIGRLPSRASQVLSFTLIVKTARGSMAARLHNNLGWIELRWDNYAAAAREFEAALTRLGHLSEGIGTEVFDIWLESQIGLVELHYCWDEPEKIAAVFSVIDPAFKARGMPRERQPDYFGALLLWQLAERRHRVDEEVLDTARKGLAATKAFSRPTGLGGNLMHEDMGWKVFNIGIRLLFYGDLDGAEQNLTEAVRIADQVGGVAMRAESMTYLNLLALRRHDSVAVASLAAHAIEAVNAASKPQYAATAKASLAWVAWKTGRLVEVEDLAQEALASWPAGNRFPFQWVCLWPLIAVRLDAGQLGEAVDAARHLLPAPQQRLPDELEDEVQAAIGAWEGGDPGRAAETLAAALKLAEELRFA